MIFLNFCRNHAQRVKTNVEEVQEALKKAKNASSQAEIAKMKAVEDVTTAEKVMKDVSFYRLKNFLYLNNIFC